MKSIVLTFLFIFILSTQAIAGGLKINVNLFDRSRPAIRTTVNTYELEQIKRQARTVVPEKEKLEEAAVVAIPLAVLPARQATYVIQYGYGAYKIYKKMDK